MKHLYKGTEGTVVTVTAATITTSPSSIPGASL